MSLFKTIKDEVVEYFQPLKPIWDNPHGKTILTILIVISLFGILFSLLVLAPYLLLGMAIGAICAVAYGYIYFLVN